MGWAKRFWARKPREAGTAAVSTQGGFERLDAKLARRLGTVEGCLELAERLQQQHRRAGRGLRGEERQVHEMVLAAGQGLTRENVKSLFEGVEEELPRTLLAQALLALYAWDPASVVLTTMDFEQQMAECLAVQGLIERLAEATRDRPDLIRDSLPDSLGRRVMSCGLLSAMRRPLGLLAPDFRATALDLPLPGVRFDGVLIERDRDRGGPGRELVLQSEPVAESSVRALEREQIQLLRFPAEEIMGSFRAGLVVVEHVCGWGWQPLGHGDELEDD